MQATCDGWECRGKVFIDTEVCATAKQAVLLNVGVQLVTVADTAESANVHKGSSQLVSPEKCLGLLCYAIRH